MRRIVLTIAVVGLAGTLAAQGLLEVRTANGTVQGTVPAGNAKITGRVVDARTGAGLGGAMVRLHKMGMIGGTDPIPTGADGSFVFDRVSTGLWTVSANVGDYGSGLSGITAPGDQPVTTEITDTDVAKDVVVRMFKRATVSGRVTDASGRPVANAAIWLVSNQWVGGRMVQRVSRGNGGDTNARGEYRLSVVSAGEYVLGAAPQPSPQLSTVMPIYYGNVARLTDAKAIVVGDGDALTRIDFTFPGQPTMTLEGELTNVPDTWQLFSVQLMPIEANGRPGPISVGVTTVDPARNRFMFRGLREGDYQLSVLRLPGKPEMTNARPPLGFVSLNGGSMEHLTTATPEGPTWYAEQVVTVPRGGARDVKVNLSQGHRLAGRVQFNGTTEKPQGSRLNGIVIHAAHERWSSTPFQARVETDGSFRTVGLPPGKYSLTVVGLPAGWRLAGISNADGADFTVRDVTVGTADVGDLVVTFSDLEPKLTGTVVDQTGAAAMGEVIVFPADPRQWIDFSAASHRVRRIATTDRGNYSAAFLLPGEYFIVAVRQGYRVQFEPDTLSRLAPLATKVTLTPGQAITSRLTVQQFR